MGPETGGGQVVTSIAAPLLPNFWSHREPLGLTACWIGTWRGPGTDLGAQAGWRQCGA